MICILKMTMVLEQVNSEVYQPHHSSRNLLSLNLRKKILKKIRIYILRSRYKLKLKLKHSSQDAADRRWLTCCKIFFHSHPRPLLMYGFE